VLLGGAGPAPLTPAGHPRLHYPDVAITPGDASGGTLAVELERTIKGRTRLRSILRAYIAARHIERVRYYATREDTRRLLEDEISRLHAETLFDVRAQAHGTSEPTDAAA
jgi:hypothetical protein